MSDDFICRSRIYQCTCGFVGAEEKAMDHQVKCDNPMERIA